MHAHAGRAAGGRAARKAPVVAVNNEDKALRVLIVVAPQGADLVLATHIPHSEADVLVPETRNVNIKITTRSTSPGKCAHSLHSLNVEADGGNRGDLKRQTGMSGGGKRGSSATYDFTELELVQDGGLAGSVKPNHQNSHFLLGKETLE